jgi:hypothetical protein
MTVCILKHGLQFTERIIFETILSTLKSQLHYGSTATPKGITFKKI